VKSTVIVTDVKNGAREVPGLRKTSIHNIEGIADSTLTMEQGRSICLAKDADSSQVYHSISMQYLGVRESIESCGLMFQRRGVYVTDGI